MQVNVKQLVQAIHDAPHQLVLVTAGAGTRALSDLLGVSGASRTLLEALVPYSAAAFDEFLEQTPKQYVARKTARLLAGRALTRARWLAHGRGVPVIGMACTATIVTDRPKRGEHRAHIAIWQHERLTAYSLTLQKGARDRTGEEALISHLMLNALATACGLSHALPLPTVPGDRLAIKHREFGAAAAELLAGERPFFAIHPHGHIAAAAAQPQTLLPGAFHPLHDGHLGLARAARRILGRPVAFELSAANVDKPPLPPEALLDRLAQFAGRYTVYATAAPTFLEKARLFPHTTFVVGYDTAQRILQPRYYQHDSAQMRAALAEIRQQDCRFLVAGRVDEHNGHFQELTDLDVPSDYVDLFEPIPASAFRQDISSTRLRTTGQRGSR